MKSGIITENKNVSNLKEVVRGMFPLVFKTFSLEVHADEDPTKEGEDSKAGNTELEQPTINYEDLISKARKEEKEKQYKKIKSLEQKVEDLTKKLNDALLKNGSLEADLDKANEKLTNVSSNDSEQVKTLKSDLVKVKKDLEKVTKEKENLEESTVPREELEKEIRTELEKEYEVKTYKAEKMAEHKDDILVPELVMGNTVEEIDASIKSALERSENIRQKLGIAKTQSPQLSSNGRTPSNPTNPSVSGVQNQQFSDEYIAGLDIHSSEYAEFRKKMGLK